MLRTHTCGELRISDTNKEVTLAGWVQKVRNKGGLIWVDLRDRYGVTQLILEEGSTEKQLLEKAASLGREFVIQAKGNYFASPDDVRSDSDSIPQCASSGQH